MHMYVRMYISSSIYNYTIQFLRNEKHHNSQRSCESNILFRKFAKVPSVIDSPMKGTTASTRSPTMHDGTVKTRQLQYIQTRAHNKHKHTQKHLKKSN
jgi:hypothetical protein